LTVDDSALGTRKGAAKCVMQYDLRILVSYSIPERYSTYGLVFACT